MELVSLKLTFLCHCGDVVLKRSKLALQKHITTCTEKDFHVFKTLTFRHQVHCMALEISLFCGVLCQYYLQKHSSTWSTNKSGFARTEWRMNKFVSVSWKCCYASKRLAISVRLMNQLPADSHIYMSYAYKYATIYVHIHLIYMKTHPNLCKGCNNEPIKGKNSWDYKDLKKI